MNRTTKNKPLGFAACALASTFWGCGFFFGKIALAEMNVGAMVLFRWSFAFLVLLPVMLRTRPRFSAREWRTLAIAWMLGVPVQFLLQFKGLSLTTVSHASLMVGTMPVILAIGATLFAHERLHGWGWFAIAVSTCGACLIAISAGTHGARSHGTQPGEPTLAGDLLVVVSLAIALGWVLLNQRMMRDHSAIQVTAWGTLVGVAMLWLAVPLLYGAPPVHGISTKAWLASAAAGVLCTASSTFLWNWGMTQVPASQAGVLLNMEPLMGSILGVALLHEHLGTPAYIGGAMIVVAAVALTTHASRPAQEATAAAEF